MSEWAVPGYTELKSLGSGGFGTVKLARHDATGTAVAIKYLRPDALADPEFAAMFRAEAITLGSLDDPNVVRLYEYVESPDGAAIVMELVDGVSVREILTRQGKTTAEAALVVLYGSLLGLAAAHARGVVHRDYKPENVLVNGHGASKLTDFGIAARSGTTTVPAGTLAYAPPEQFSGAPATPASDVYAATATFYECLTGHPPFTGKTTEAVAEQHRTAEVRLEPVPEPLRPLVAAGMAKDPGDRPASASALAAALRGAAAGACGGDWESRGRSHLGEAALLLAALWPSAGVPALQGSTTEQVHLSQGTAHHPQLGRAERHRLHLWHVRHEEHLEHLRYLRHEEGAAAAGRAGRAAKPSGAAGRLRAVTAAVTGAAVVAAAVTVVLTSRSGPPQGTPGSAGHPVVAGYQVRLEAVGVASVSSFAPVTGDVLVTYNRGSHSIATLSGSVKGALGGQVVRLYARQFPYTGPPVVAGSAALNPVDGTAAYSFKVTPALATRYQVLVFSGATATAPIGESGVTTVYVGLGRPPLHVNCVTGQPVCSIKVAETFYAPPSIVQKEMSKHWYIYFGVNTQPGDSYPPQPAAMELGADHSTVSDPRRTGADSFTLTITFSYNHGDDWSTFVWDACAQDTEQQDGFGLPGSHSCGTESAIPTTTPYLG